MDRLNEELQTKFESIHDDFSLFMTDIDKMKRSIFDSKDLVKSELAVNS
jgi:GGDEF domain-containing protein